jgi:hypothetical protein
VLEVGATAGTLITDSADAAGAPAEIARALQASSPQRGPGEAVAEIEAEASEVTGLAQEAVDLFTAVVDGSVLERGRLAERIRVMLGMLQRLAGEGRWAEALTLARAIAGLLLLLKRWADLVNTLRIAIRAATERVDPQLLAWAEHELGTLHLAAGDDAGAEGRLARAEEIRERIGDRAGLAATRHNLGTLCRHLRRRLHEDGDRTSSAHRRGRRVAICAAAVVLLLVGGAAGAIVHPGTSTGTQQLTVAVVGDGTVRIRPGGVECRHRCHAEFSPGRAVSLRATALGDATFSGWEGGGCSGQRRRCTVAAQDDVVVSARFAAAGTAQPPPTADPPVTTPTTTSPTVALMVEAAPPDAGTVTSDPSAITCPSVCTAPFPRGTPVVLTATAADGFDFTRWSTDCASANPCTVTLDQPATVTASFTSEPVTTGTGTLGEVG